MAKGFPWSWKEAVAIVALSGISLVILLHDGSPTWLRAMIMLLVTVGPFLPVLALIPWHFIAKHQGLMSRSPIPTIVSYSNGVIQITRGNKRTSHPFEHIVRARLARNDNWTESTMLEDALGLFAVNGREIVRLPESATGFAALLAELNARGIPIEYVDVSAPSMLD
jgi:hypothetical protein